jgi:hypothetical protein
VVARLPQRPPPWWEDAPPSSLLPWPPLPAPLTTIPGGIWRDCPPGGFGTLSLELSAGSEPIGERDVLGTFLGVAQVSLDYRRRLGDSLWLRLGVFGRGREGTDPIAGLGARSYLRDLPLGLRADARVDAATQPYAGAQASSLLGSLRLDRSFRLSRDVSLVPSLSARAAWLSLDREAVVDGDEVDPDVYNDYLRTHPIQLTARAAVYVAPWSDQVGVFQALAASTRSLGVDLAGAELEWRSLFPILGETYSELTYRPTYRLVTADRLEALLRHDVSLRLRWSLFTGTTGRIVLWVQGWLVASPSSFRQGVNLVLRYDFTGGRGLGDILPVEESFESLLDKRDWEPAPPGRL